MTQCKEKSKRSDIVMGIALGIISCALSLVLFAVLLDRLLLSRFDDAFLSVSMRLLLSLILFQILWSLFKKSLIKPVFWISGLFYCLLLLYVVMIRTSGRTGVNLNPFTIIHDFMTIPFYPISNFLFFIPVGFFVGYVFRKKITGMLYLSGFVVSLILEVFQLIFQLGIFDISDIILNGSGFAVGVWLFVTICRNPKVSVLFMGNNV